MQKILKIVVLILGLLGVVFLARIIAAGDDAVKAAAAAGDTSLVEPMTWVAYIILAMVLAFVVYFVLKNLFSNTATLKNTLISVGAFVAVLLIAYFVSGGDATPYFYNNIQATPGESQLVGAGLVAFYVLIVISILVMLFSGIKKMIK